jgi:hypothetical protein
MSEPSLRDTVAGALAKVDGYAHSDKAWLDNGLRYERMADAALSVIRERVTQAVEQGDIYIVTDGGSIAAVGVDWLLAVLGARE